MDSEPSPVPPDLTALTSDALVSIENEVDLTDTDLRVDGTADRSTSTGAFFPQAQDFVVSGGTFTSVTNVTQNIPERPDGACCFIQR